MLKAVVFDLDGTLIDTNKIKECIYEAAMIHRYSEDEAKEIYQASRLEGNKVVITLDRSIEFIKKRVIEDGKEFKEAEVSELVKSLRRKNDLSFAGAEELLEDCKRHGLEIYLLSLGQEEWLKYKLELANLSKHFDSDKVHFTEMIGTGKIEGLKKFFGQNFSGENVAFVNDKEVENNEVKCEFPRIICFLRGDFKSLSDLHEELKKRYFKKI